jgi:hypothetical protein
VLSLPVYMHSIDAVKTWLTYLKIHNNIILFYFFRSWNNTDLDW